MTARLSCENLTLSYGKVTVLKDVSLTLPEGKITAIVGPNACGKSSLLRCLCRLQSPTQGQVRLNDAPIHKLNTRDVARQVALLPQKTNAPEGMRVRDLVIRGRTPHQSPLRQWSHADQTIVDDAIERVGLTARAEQLLSDLSGGQMQRAWIAMVLAQDTPILLLDEPTTFLDLPHQRDILQLVRDLQRDKGLTVAMVLHDINLAARFADQIVALKQQKIVAAGAPIEVVTQPNISEIYGLDCAVIPDPHYGHPHIIMK